MRTDEFDNIRFMCAKTRHSRSFQHSQGRVRKDFSASRRGEEQGEEQGKEQGDER
jgi:hypothetical protein